MFRLKRTLHSQVQKHVGNRMARLFEVHPLDGQRDTIDQHRRERATRAETVRGSRPREIQPALCPADPFERNKEEFRRVARMARESYAATVANRT